MKIGILATGENAKEIAVKHGKYEDMFIGLFANFDNSIEWKSYSIHQDEFPASATECDAWLITGSKHGVYEDFAWIGKLEEFIRDIVLAKKKLIGICFGHQIIAQAMGGKVVKSDKGFGIGGQGYTLDLPPELINLAPQKLTKKTNIRVNAMHGDQVVKMPKTAQLIASSDFCELAGFYYPEGILTVQPHPEFGNEFSNDLINLRSKLYKDWATTPPLNTAMQEKNQPNDSLEISQLLLNFMTKK